MAFARCEGCGSTTWSLQQGDEENRTGECRDCGSDLVWAPSPFAARVKSATRHAPEPRSVIAAAKRERLDLGRV
jgi:hypothetical protein